MKLLVYLLALIPTLNNSHLKVMTFSNKLQGKDFFNKWLSHLNAYT